MRLATPARYHPCVPRHQLRNTTLHAHSAAGGDPHILVLKNLTPADVAASCEALVKELDQKPDSDAAGRFSGGDEPDGSAKFIAAFFRNPLWPMPSTVC